LYPIIGWLIVWFLIDILMHVHIAITWQPHDLTPPGKMPGNHAA
jgi:hypothetical protein